MKNKSQIKKAINLNKELLKFIPKFAIDGTNNHRKTQLEIYALTRCIDKACYEIEDWVREKLNCLNQINEDWCDNSEIRVYDWVLGKIDEDLITKKEVEFWRKKREQTK